MARISKMAGAMTAGEFARAASQFPRFSEKAVAVARAVLVDGHSADEAAAQHGSSRQLAHKWALKLYDSFRPDGWLTEAITLPPDKMALVRQMEADARHAWAEALPAARVVRR